MHSNDVNEEMRDITGEDFTAKDFRTWIATVTAFGHLRSQGPFTSQEEAKSRVLVTVRHVASLLGNTPTVCRKSYIHPVVISSYLEGRLVHRTPKSQAAAVLALLRAV